jgi:hypothetical protein
MISMPARYQVNLSELEGFKVERLRDHLETALGKRPPRNSAVLFAVSLILNGLEKGEITQLQLFGSNKGAA